MISLTQGRAVTFASQRTGCNQFPCQKMPPQAWGKA